MTDDWTRSLRDAIAEAESLIANPPFDITEQERAEGYDYLAGSIRASLQAAFDYDLVHPVLMNGTHQYSRQGLDNPDAIYFNAYLDADGTYEVSGVRGTTADLSFQLMDGNYTASETPTTLAAFDDRELDIADDGSFSWRFGPEIGLSKGTNLIIREVYSDWVEERRGTIRIQRLDTAGIPRAALSRTSVAKRYDVAAKALTGRIRTWFEFPKWFTYTQPVNTFSTPRSTPGGLASQYSSLGHYDLTDDQALVVTVPVCEAAGYQAIQIGSKWYVSTDYEHRQSSLTAAQSQADPDGMFRYVISTRNPGIVNWLDTTDHRTGTAMMRWQRVERPLTDQDGPSVELVTFDDLAEHLPFHDHNQITPRQYAERIADRQVGVAQRMIS
ncbi:hypothetical protein BJ980_002371 [Nocardioides daedukensis]|uniref:DUF1214 domain-containing protein n=1 Tax=Nocardioides daedukensis TaxID=634462 RepID=A0A7Y9S3N0_9ACTN|nr:hypothetical protein [Nocardioides daedukensis]NYG59448.1 hypothetical protein [Nocardioides daedukensis]